MEKELFRFADEKAFWWLLLIPFLVVLFVFAIYLKKMAIKRFGDLAIITSLMPEVSIVRQIAKFILVTIALVLIIIALARPQFGSKLREVKRKGIELVIALDISNSMMAQDIQPNRLDNAKLALSRMIEKMENDKIGLIVFAGDAYTQLPITTDYEAAKMFISSVKPEMISRQGTAVGAAINLATKSFGPEAEKSKVILIISDGENHEDDAVGAAKAALEKGIIIHAIGLGSPEGAPIPMSGNMEFRKDNDGSVVVTRLNEQLLQQVATAGGGQYARSSNTLKSVTTIYDEISKMDKQEIEAKVYSDYNDRFQYFVGGAIFFILLELLFLERKNRLFRNINLFNIKVK